ncbi:hypothetical protein ACEPAF_8426 [Sanghuangporus sanghuang]
MPRRRPASSTSPPLSSTPRSPAGVSGDSLPLPTTLLTHVQGSRILRAASHSSRASRSHSASALNSRNSSRTRHSEATDASQHERENATPGPSNLNGEAPNRPTRSLQTGGRRRRAYSIRDELDDEDQSYVQSVIPSPSSSEGYAPPEMSPRRPSPKRKRRTVLNKRTIRRRKLNNSQVLEVNTDPGAGPSTLPSTSTQVTTSEPDVEIIRLYGEPTTNGVYEIESSSPLVTPKATTSASAATVSSEPLAEYTCPICFSTPTNATMTPCGHVCCGECLFTAVRSTLQRAPPMPAQEPNVARCPVCRATINGWDGRGGGVIGLKPRSIISL